MASDRTGSRASSRRPSQREGFTNLTSSLPTAIVDRLDNQCKLRVVGRNLIIVRALDEYLTRLEAQEVLP